MRILAFLGLFLLLILVGASVGEYRDIRYAIASESWPTADAVVTYVGQKHTSKKFEYTYQVEGRVYKGWRAGYALSPFHQEYHYHDVGDTIRVRYDPADPERAVVRPGVTLAGVMGGVLPILVMFAIGVYVAAHVRLRD